jgi:hypothetical protein
MGLWSCFTREVHCAERVGDCEQGFSVDVDKEEHPFEISLPLLEESWTCEG